MDPDGIRVLVEGLHRSYGRVEALAGVDLELGTGVTGLLGPNGAGKAQPPRLRGLGVRLLPPAPEGAEAARRAAPQGARGARRGRPGGPGEPADPDAVGGDAPPGGDRPGDRRRPRAAAAGRGDD